MKKKISKQIDWDENSKNFELISWNEKINRWDDLEVDLTLVIVLNVCELQFKGLLYWLKRNPHDFAMQIVYFGMKSFDFANYLMICNFKIQIMNLYSALLVKSQMFKIKWTNNQTEMKLIFRKTNSLSNRFQN